MKHDYVVVCIEDGAEKLRTLKGIHIRMPGSILCKEALILTVAARLGEDIDDLCIMSPEEYLEEELCVESAEIEITYNSFGDSVSVSLIPFIESVCETFLNEHNLRTVSDWFEEAVKYAQSFALDDVLSTMTESIFTIKTSLKL